MSRLTLSCGERPCKPSRRARVARPYPGWLWTALAGLVVLTGLAAPAAAQTVQTLVSNSGESRPLNGSSSISAQSIRTGDHESGYTVSQIELHAFTVASRSTTVKLYSNSDSGEPQDLVATLVNPDTFTQRQFNTFTAPSGTMLSRNTTYWIVVNEDSGDSAQRLAYSNTGSDVDTSSYGWSIGNERLIKSSPTTAWRSNNFVLSLTVKGNFANDARTSDTTPPTLETAEVNGATMTLTYDETLDTASVPAASDYTVSVADATRSLASATPVAVSGSTVALTLSSAVTPGQTVTVSYAVPSTNPVQDAAGNDAEALSSQAVTNNTRTAANTAPTAAANTVTTNEDTAHTFAADDFGFMDADSGDALESVKIESLPAAGTGELQLDNVALSSVSQMVTKAQLDDGDLEYVPPANANGDAYASFTFKVNDGTADSASPYSMTVNVTAVNDAPAFSDATLTRSVAENSAANVNVGAVIPEAADADVGATLEYSMEGADAASFNFNVSTRQITTKSGVHYDFEAKRSHSVTIKVSDGTDSDTVAVTINVTDQADTGDSSLSPSADDVVPARKSQATYSIRIEGSWNTGVTPGSVPGGAHFTTFVGGIHNDQVTFLESGGRASAGVESMAELGGTSRLVTEVDGAKPDAVRALTLSAPGVRSSRTHNGIAFTSDHPRITLTSMIAPSPDWFVGVSGRSLLDSSGNWLSPLTVNLYPWDAGTEDGSEFSLSNPSTSPKGVISSIRGRGKFTGEHIARLVFTRTGSVEQAPAAPTTFAATPSDAEVTLGWDVPTETGITGHEYRRKTDGAYGAWTAIPDSAPGGANEDSFTVTGLTNDTIYTFQLRAVNSVGGGASSTEIAATPEEDEILPTLVLNVGVIAGDGTVNIAEKTAGFTISGDTDSEAGVSITVTVGATELTATSADADPATWSVSVPADASYITGTSVDVTVSATKTGFTAPGDVQRTLTVDLTAPPAPTYTAPDSLKVGVAIAAMGPSGGTGIDAYSATGLPPGLSIDTGTGAISGTPDTADANTADATVTVSDAAGNSGTVDITFPAVAKGDQTLTGFQYSASSVTLLDSAPSVTAPTGVQTTLSYSATPSTACTVNSSSGALTLAGVGSCVITATAAGNDDYNEATATFTVAVQAAGELALNLDAVATDNTVNVAEKTAGFTISGDTGTESGVDVTVQIGTETLTATSADNAGTATWSVSVPADASYITGPSVAVEVNASKTDYTSPSAITRTLTVDLTAPTAPTYTAPGSLKVGVAITAMSPTGGIGIDAYSATGLPPGLSIAAATGVIGGTPDTAQANTTSVTVTASDTAGNTAEVSIAFPAVAKGEQTLTGFQYSASSVTFGSTAPTVAAPGGVVTTLSYSATPSTVCTVNSTTGALTLAGVGSCVITATAAGTDDYDETTVTFTVTVQAAGALVLNLDTIAVDDTVNIAEKTAGFTISGDTASEAGVSIAVTVGATELTATSADDNGTATWSVSVPAAASYITGTSVDVTVSATKTGFTAPGDVQRTLTVDLTAPTAPTYTAPASLKVGAAIATMSPSGGSGIDGYSATGLPPGLSIAAATGVIDGTPDTADANTADATVTVRDAAGNTGTVDIAFPAVAKGEQTLTGFRYSASSVTFGSTAPTVTAPGGVVTTLSYSATPSTVCTVNSTTGALTLAGVGSCVITATAAGTDDYDETTAMFTVAVQAAGALVLNLDTIAVDDTVNIAEKTAGFTISGDTGSETGVSVTVTVGSTELTATSADDNGTATWSVSVPADASYITGTSVDVTVSATKAGFTAPGDVERTLTVDLTAPTAPTYPAPDSLKVGVAIAAMSPSGGSGIDEYSASGLPSGLSIDSGTGAISDTPDTADADSADATVTVSDIAGNTDRVDITFPAVAKGDQALTGFQYSSSSVTFGSTAPTVTAPSGVQTAVSYSATPSTVCTVNSSTGALTIVGAGSCVVTATAASTSNYNEATGTYTVTVQPAGTLVLNVDAIATDNTVNIAEKAAGFTISGDTGSVGGVGVTVTVGTTELTATSSTADPALWSVSVPADATYITATSVEVEVNATKAGHTAPSAVERTLKVDLTAPTAPTYTAPTSLKVGVAIAAMGPSGGTGIDAYSATGLPPGLSIDTGTGAISGTPDTADANTADATVTVSDAAGNSGTVDITFPAVAKGDQTLTGFQYSASSVTLLDSAPSVTAPTGVQTTLSYSATPSTACTVNSSSGALTLAGVGSCVITATAAGNDDYNEATATFTLVVQAAGELVLNLDAVATDNTVNVAEKTAGFTISGDTGTESGVDVTVQIGTETLTATSADNAGTATWSVSVPANASYITGPSVAVEVNASKTGYTSPSAITRTLTVDLTAPTAPTYTAPASLKVGVAIAAMSPTGGIGIDAYSATGLPPGLSIAAATGVIGGTPDAAEANTASVTVTASDTAGNTAEVSITFPAVAKGDQTLTGFQYSASSATFGSTAPTVTAPGGVETTLSYAAAPSEVCTVDPSSGALTLAGVGSCVITATAAGTDDYNEATATFTVAVQAAVGTLVLNLDAVATDNTVNVAEKTAGFTISGDTGTESGVDVTVQIGTETLTATSADNAGTATWSVSVLADASYITGTSVDVTVSATKTAFIAPGDVQRTLTVDLTAPTAPTYTAPASLKVGVAITAMSPSGGSGIDEYSATGLPTGLSIAAATGAIGGTPDTADANTADATVTVSDTAGNTGTVDIAFPAVAKGDQTLTGFQYSAPSVAFGSAAPTVTAPGGVVTTLSYAATPSAVCTVNSSTGALTLAGVGNCEVTATAASTANYNEATATFTVTVQAVGALVLNLDAVATDNTVNIAEKTAGFTISGDTGTESGVDVTVTVGTTELTATSAEADPATWSVSVPADASYITGTSVDVTVSATKTGFTAPAAITRTLTVDLTAPTAPTYTAPASLKVGVAIAAMSPSGGIGIDEYSATGLPPGLSIAASTGVIDGTPDTADANTADATVTVSDAAGNTVEVSITFPAVAKGDQTLTGFQYSASSVAFGSTAPTVTAPGGVETTLSYSATPSTVCTVNSSSGALTLAGVGGCVITATAAGTDDYDETTVTFTVTVQAVGTLVLNLDAVATDNTINIDEKAAGFSIGGDTGSETGVSVTVTVGSTELTATSADDNGTATWSVSVPANASYIAGTSVDVEVNASKIGYTAPSAIARTVTVDLTAPTAPTYTAPASLTVGVTISAISPTGGVGIDEYAVTGLPSGLSLDTGTGAIGGTPDTADANAASATVTVSDVAGNTAEVSIAFPAVTKGDQTLSGFQYSASSVTFGSAAPTVTAPTGVQTTVSYAATPSRVCTVDSSTGALTLVGSGECVVTATAASTANYNEASATYTVTVQASGTSGGRTDSTAVTLTVDLATVNEGAGATALTVTGTLDEAPRTADTTVTVSVGASGDSAVAGTDYAAVGELKLSIGAGQTSGTVTFTLTPTDDGLIEGDETLTVTGTTGLADLTVTGTSITIGDDDERRVAISPTSLTVAEGDSASYTVVLGSRPSGTVRVTISGTTGTDLSRSRSFLSFRTSNWNEPQTVTVTARQDEDAEDDTVTLVHAVTGADYEANGVTADAVTVTIDDDDVVSTGVELSVSPASVEEDAGFTGVVVTGTLNGVTRDEATTVTVSVGASDDAAIPGTDYVAVDDVSVTIPAGQASGTATFTFTPLEDRIDEPDEAVSITGTTEVEGFEVSGTTLTIDDNDERGVTVSPTDLSLTEGASATYTVVLDTEPTETVTVTPSVRGRAHVTVSADESADAVLTFTATDWDEAQTVTVTAAQDADAGNDKATIGHAVAGGDYGANSATADDVSVTVDDDETAVLLTVNPTAVDEDGSGIGVTVTGTFDGVTRDEPTTVTVSVGASDDAAIAGADYVAVDDLSLTIPSGQASATATFTFTPLEDRIDERVEAVSITGTTEAAGFGVSGATLSIADNDERGVTVSATDLSLSEGESATYTVVLDTQPTGDVTVTPSLGSGDTDVTVSAALTFTATDWDQAQTVTVSAAQDADAASDEATIVHVVSGADYAANGATADDVSVMVEDDETTVTLTVNPAAVDEDAGGTSVTVTGALDGVTRNEPTTVTVSVGASDDAAIAGTDYVAVDDLSVTIPSGEASGTATFTLTPLEDRVDEPDEAVSIAGTTEVAGFEVIGTTLSIDDNDERGVTVSPTDLSLSEGVSTIYTVVLNTEPTETVTVTPTVNGSPDVTFTPSSLMFTPSDWDTAQTVTVSAAQDADAANDTATIGHAVAGADYGANGVTADDMPVTVEDDETAVTLTVNPAAVDEGAGGTSVTVTGTLDGVTRDEPTTLTVSVGAPDDAATEGTDYAAVNDLSLTIPAGQASGTATFTLTPMNDLIDERVEAVSITGTSQVAGFEVIGTTLVIADNDERGVTVSPSDLSLSEGASATYTVVLDTEPTQTVTVTPTVSGSPDLTFTPSSLTFTSSDWDTAQTVTVSATEDDDAYHDSSVVSHAAEGAEYASLVDGELSVTISDNEMASDDTLPAQVTDVRAAATATHVDLTWAAAEDTVLGYRVEASYDGGANWAEVEDNTESADSTETIDSAESADSTDSTDSTETIETSYRHDVGLNFAETRRYRVSAVGENGAGLPSVTLQASATVATGGLTAIVALPGDTSDTMPEDAMESMSEDTTDSMLEATADPAPAIDLCWIPEGVAASELSDVAMAWTPVQSSRSLDLSDLSWQSIGSGSSQVDCEDGIGVRVTSIGENQRYAFRMRANHDGVWLISNDAEALLVDSSKPLRTEVTAGASGLSGDTPVPGLICRDYDDPATTEDEAGSFFLSIGFTTTSAEYLRYEPVNDFDPSSDLTLVNATAELLDRPYDTQLGYRVRITPSVWGEPVAVSLAADVVTHGETSVGNQASGEFRRETSDAVDCDTATAEPVRRSQVVAVGIEADGDRNGEWTAGEPIRVTLQFDEPVRVTTTDGIPSVSLTLGEAATEATEQSTDGEAATEQPADGEEATEQSSDGEAAVEVIVPFSHVAHEDTLVFEHPVTANESPIRNIALLAGSLSLNGGAIDSFSGPAADLAHPEAAVVGGQIEQPDLTAGWSTIPGAHEGSESHFEIHLQFSETVDLIEVIGERNLLEHAFTVTNGAIEAIRPARDRRGEYLANEWAMRVVPDSDEAVTISPVVATACDEPGAICTIDDRPLTEAPSVTIHRIEQALSAADTEVGEGPGAVLVFEVTLARAADQAVTVDYATADGTATAGEDYEAVSGTLSIEAGQTTASVQVRVLDDSHDEGEETLTLILSNASNAQIHDGEALGIIVNSDPIPSAWLARFGRAASDHVAQAVARRLERGPSEEHMTVGGLRLDRLFTSFGQPDGLGAASASTRVDLDSLGSGAGQPPLAWSATGSGYQHAQPEAGLSTGTISSGPTGGFDAQRLAGDVTTPYARTSRASDTLPSLRDVLLGSSFFYTFGDSEDTSSAPLTAWGETASTRFKGSEGALSLDGEVTTAMLGLDKRYGRWLVGSTLSYSEGEGGYQSSGALGGSMDSTLTSLNPYAHFELNETTSLWGVFGYGSGSLRVTPQGAQSAIETDLSNRMAAFGGRGRLSVRTGDAGRFELALRSDALVTRTDSDAVQGLAGAQGATSRVRLMLEGSGSMPLATGGVLKPSLEAGLRYDGGDAETGAGIELGGGLGYAAGSLSVEVNARALVAHEDTEYEEWGFSGSLAYTPGKDGRGLSMKLGSAWGSTQSGVQSLWTRQDASGLARNAAFEAAQRFQAELGYGIAGRRKAALWVPFIAAQAADGDSQSLRMGVKLTSGPRVEAAFELGWLETGRGEREHGVQLGGELRW